MNESREHQAEYRIDHAQDDGVARDRLEIFPAQLQRPMQVGQANGPDDGSRRAILGGSVGVCDISLILRGHGRRLP